MQNVLCQFRDIGGIMKKKNGFISTTVVYTFFFVFLMMLLFVVRSYASNRQILRVLKTDVKNDISDSYLSRYLINHKDETAINLTYHNEALANGAKDFSYRFSGANPNNYICIASTASPCPTNNLYRIIGVIDGRVKVIKYTSLGNMQWNNFASSSWANSSLITYLNSTYLNTLGTTKDLIEENSWYVLGLSLSDGSGRVQNAYNKEVGPNKPTQNAVVKKIGLMYASDYGYATTSNYWTSNLASYSSTVIKNNNWLDNFNENMWILPPVIDASNTLAYYLKADGAVGYSSVMTSYAIRPTFYLKSSVKKQSGSGTYSDPYRIG